MENILIDFLKFHYKENEFRKNETNELDVENFIKSINCDEKINRQSIGYEQTYDKCKHKGNFNIVWKTSSGTYSRYYCLKHKNLKEKELLNDKFSTIISITQLKQ